MTTEQREWRREYEARWCPGPVDRAGHLLPCSLVDGHDGDCVATLRDVREHRRGGQAACVKHGCGTRQRDTRVRRF